MYMYFYCVSVGHEIHFLEKIRGQKNIQTFSFFIGWNRRNWNIGCKQEKSSGIKRSHFISICMYLFIIVEEHLMSVLDERNFGDVPEFGSPLKYGDLWGKMAQNGSFSGFGQVATTPYQSTDVFTGMRHETQLENCSKESTIARQPNILSKIRPVQNFGKGLLYRSLCSDSANSFS